VTPFARRWSRSTIATGSSLLALSVLVLVSIVLHGLGLSGAAAAPGAFLVGAFSWAALFVPAYLGAAAWLLAAPRFKRRSAILLMLSILPFLTLSLLIHVLSGAPSAAALALLDSFGAVPSALLLFLLLALEAILMLTLPRKRVPEERDLTPLALPFWQDDEPGPEAAARGTEAPVAVMSIITDAVEPAAVGPAASAAAPVEADPQPEAADDADDAPVDPVEAESPDEAAADEAARAEPGAEAADAADADADAAAAEETAPDADPVPEEAGLEPAVVAPLPKTRKQRVIVTPRPEQEELPFPKPAQYGIPVHDVLKNRGDNEYWVIDDVTKDAAKILTDALKEFNIDAEVTGIRKGPVITLFEVLPAPGVRISKIANLADNIALRLAAPSVRIVAPIPGRHAVGIEVPNKTRAVVSFREMISLDAVQKSSSEIPIVLGKDILGEAQVIDLVQTPHLLIGGATNSGKSVLVNSVICSILFRRSPDEVRLFLIDPKIVELKLYNGCPHLLTPVITDPKKAFQALTYCISEMERRYTLLDALGVRDIRSFNKKARKEHVQRLPYIVIVIDEFADLMATTGKELESTLARLAAMARAVGIHMVLATQRPSIDVITGLIKANIPSRIAFMVANKFDSRIIIDAVGAEKLLGKGDMLFSAAWNPFPVRIQGALIDDEETDAVTEYVKKLGPPQYIDDEVFFDDEETGEFEGEPGNDPLYERALEIVMSQGKASASYIQRRLKVGYNRAARLVEEMEERGIVGPAMGSKPREILHIPGKG
jgi:DNA segregation ATPase FtsK/SpoIIIE, S-DNA-T family